MQYRVFAIPVTGSSDLEDELNQFLRSHRIVSVQKTVEVVDGAPRWCFCLEYLEGGAPTGRSKRVDYKEHLSEEDFAVFARLRDARKALAESQAIPVYAVCTNEQLAAMATRRPGSVSALKEIDGFGDAKAAKYGKSFLSAIVTDPKEPNETSGPSD